MKVKTLKIKGQAALVEWDDGALRRGTVPAESLRNDQVDDDVLAMAIPHGEPWTLIIGDIEATPQAVEDELHKRGVWTAQDLLSKRGAARDAIATAIGADAAKLIRYAAGKGR